MEESAFIKCQSCLSEVEISRSSFYKLAGQAIRCPECSSPIPISAQSTWEEFSGGHQSPANLTDLQEKMAADFHSAMRSDEASEPEQILAAAPPSAGRRSSPAAFSKTKKGINKAILVFGAALLLCGAGLWIFTRSSDFSPPPAPAVETPAAAPTTTTTIPPPLPPPVVVEAPAPKKNEERVAVLFASYQESFLKGNIEAARTALRDLNSAFSMSSHRDAFWRKNAGIGGQRDLRVMVLCSACAANKGKCPKCEGKGLCTTCKGLKTCARCKGRSVRRPLCRNCVCRACSASGLCASCQGTGRLNCRACGSTGRTEITVRDTCHVCGGSRYKLGLKSATGEASRLPCLTCRSRGWITKTRNTICGSCDGNGWIACPTCNGGGICAVCAGKGRKAPCAICGDAGQITVYCPRCDGAGTCGDCRGTGKCGLCGGSGNCSVCQGKGLTELLRLPVMSTWLIQDRGYVLIEPDGTLKREAGASGLIATQYNGRPLSFMLKPNEVVVIVQSDPADCGMVIRKQ